MSENIDQASVDKNPVVEEIFRLGVIAACEWKELWNEILGFCLTTTQQFILDDGSPQKRVIR